VLEIGCGTGRHTERLASQGNDVTALDLSAGMLAVARAKPALAHVRFIEGDVFDLEVAPGEEFDVVLAALVLEHLADLPTFFRRVASWLKAGGSAYFSEIHPSRMQAGSGARFESGGQEIRLHSIAHREEDFRGAIAAAGLIVTRKEEIPATPELIAAQAGWENTAANRCFSSGRSPKSPNSGKTAKCCKFYLLRRVPPRHGKDKVTHPETCFDDAHGYGPT
jgi:malonyl-CoA O-methyltransferase